MRKTALQKAKEKVEVLTAENLKLNRKAQFFDDIIEAVIKSDSFKEELHSLVDEEVGLAMDDLTICR